MKNTGLKTRSAEAHARSFATRLGSSRAIRAEAQLILALRHLVRDSLREFVISAGTVALAAVLEEHTTSF